MQNLTQEFKVVLSDTVNHIFTINYHIFKNINVHGSNFEALANVQVAQNVYGGFLILG